MTLFLGKGEVHSSILCGSTIKSMTCNTHENSSRPFSARTYGDSRLEDVKNA